MASAPGKKISIKGGCHCGYVSQSKQRPKKKIKKRTNTTLSFHNSFITYTAHPTLTPHHNLSATRCNCTFCQNLGYTCLHLASPSDFTLHSPASLTDSQLGDYAPKVKSVHRYFCRECGSHVWMQGEYPLGEGKVMPVLAVNLGTVQVEGLVGEGVELARTEMGYFDMLHGNVEGGWRERPWEGGLV